MRLLARRLVTATVSTFAAASLAIAIPTTSAAQTDPGPALKTPTTTLASALSCTSDLAGPGKTPILLVPGTIESSNTAYSWGYQKVLAEAGHPVCVIKSLPNGGSGDMQTTVEWVVHALRHMYATSGRKVSVIGHSQGGTITAWALRFWPDLASKVDDAVLLGSPANGSELTDWTCGSTCPPALWQFQPGSNFNRALNRFPLPATVSVSSIASTKDELVFPSATTKFSGATNVYVQDLCAGRSVGHVGLLYDAATHALVMDALNNPGTVSPLRTGTSSCGLSKFAGIDEAAMTRLINVVGELIDALLNADYIDAEPPLRDYALGRTGDTDLTSGRQTHVSSAQSSSYPGAYAVDGKAGTRWSSDWSDPQWIAVDLGAPKKINGVQLQWERAAARDYQILVSNDGKNWTTVWSTTSGNGGNDVIFLDGAVGRFVAMYGTERTSYYGYSLWDFKAVGV